MTYYRFVEFFTKILEILQNSVSFFMKDLACIEALSFFVSNKQDVELLNHVFSAIYETILKVVL